MSRASHIRHDMMTFTMNIFDAVLISLWESVLDIYIMSKFTRTNGNDAI